VLLTPEFEKEIHRRLLAGDPTAPSELAEAVFDELRSWLRRSMPKIRDPHLYEQAAADAILSYGERPGSFNPVRATLTNYLRMSARGDLLNALTRESRFLQRQILFSERVEDDELSGNTVEEPFRRYDGRNEEEAALVMLLDGREALRQFLETVPDQELAAVCEWLEGTRETSIFVQLLGLEDADRSSQEDSVKRFKDQYTQRMKRWAEKKRGRDAIQ
jgi:hypothetical protein